MIKHIKKYSILCLSIVVFLPAIVQLVHTFEKHEHGICISKDDQHFHQKDPDCQLFHTQQEYHAYDFGTNYEVIPNEFYLSEIPAIPFRIEKVFRTHKSSRAPPVYTV